MKRPTRLGAGEKLVLTANRLLDGHIVWRDASGIWHPSITHAALLDADQAEHILAGTNAQAEGLVGIYEVAVHPASPPMPTSVRERIRAFGPTVHPQFATELES
ncbi:hypothetical protein AA101099_2607 [Neoasaia chiangmaiensis NBRC 101099]|uniref:Uncharacterized protein n=1 Tax=Neoasaia chiangmaiensis TaxID=320497 RepID=A0A1U9KPI0_9PROT|nr:DUF2849 domain-containing protein [Neoasaia chiangmaiensis]AQS87722.1 hypothetical protein A0U93_07015 [Neoasaia chiangmaiensis]GBR41742.1 hypothetical protein AA101099_2607 [Neoasaia chiangmaiensis NBRC 101099]GEN14316.1 hypothetical protein NCH01_07470 [Neoasaia chiangmaiensis]